MPSLQDIEQFKSDLNAVGHEEEILAERGLTIEDVSPPESGLSDDLSQLLEIDTLGPEAAPTPSETVVTPDTTEEEPPDEEAAIDELDSDIAGLGDVEITDTDFTPEETGEIGDTGDTGEEEFDIGDIFAGLDETDIGEPVEATSPAPEEPEEPEEPGESDEEFEGISEEEYAGLTDAMDIPDELGEEAPESEEGAGEEGEVDFGDLEVSDAAETADDFSDVDFEFPDFGEEEISEEEPGTEPGLPEEFADIDFEMEAETEPEEETVESPAAGADEFEIPGEFTEEEAPIPEEEQPVDEFEAPDEFAEEPVGPSDTATEEVEETPEAFTFDDEVDEFELPAGTEGEPGFAEEEAAAGEEGAEVDEDDFDLDDFSLGDLSEQFGVSEEETQGVPTEEELNPALAVSDQLPGSEDVLDLTDDQFESLRRTLSSLPRNLRIIVEEAIGEEQLSGDNLETLVDALVRGRSPREIANITGRITGQRIVIPAAYEKRTGAEFEEEKGTLTYLFRYRILPFARTAAIVLLILGLASFLGYRFIYNPIRAAVLYNRGLAQIKDGSYIAGNEYFAEARGYWESKRRYFQYADEFIGQKRDDLAADKYEDLLQASDGFNRQGLLDYAHLEIYNRAAYPHAEELLNRILQRDKYVYDYDALLLSGDNYMQWALENPEKYENARLAFATLIQKYGERDELMFRMLEYFIRTDNLKEVITLKDYFQSIDKVTLNTKVYADLGGYLVTQDINSGRYEYSSDARDVLFRTMEADPNLPDVHYHLARLFKYLEHYDDEKTALTRAFEGYRRETNRNSLDETRFIDTMDRQGEAAFRDKEYLEAEDKYLAAKKTFEAARTRGMLKDSPLFGQIYSNLGDIYYYVSGNYPAAMNNYVTARDTGYSPPELHFKMGYIDYRNEQYEDALLHFYQAAGGFSSNPNLMFATANTLYYQGLYSSAQGYYLHVITDLETKRRNIPDLRPEERPEHRALLENLMRAYTNLGATLYRLSERNGETQKMTRALVELTTASEFFDRLTRDRNTLVRTESKNLSFLDTRAIIYPEPGFDVEIYNEIPRDMTEMEF